MNDLDLQRALYPRVSDIIGKQNADELRAIPIETLVNAGERGTQIHTYCSAWMKDLFIPGIEDEYEPYFEAFVCWANDNVKEILHVDQRLYDDEKKFTGAFDAIVILHRSPDAVLIDLKTSSSASKTWPLQLAAYHHLCSLNGLKTSRIMNVHLKKTKAALWVEKEGVKVLASPPTVKTVELEYENINHYWGIFSSALTCFDYFSRGGKNVK